MGWAVRSLTAEQLHYSASPSEWSVHQNLSHLRDMEERVYLPLLRWATVPDMLDPATYSRRNGWNRGTTTKRPSATFCKTLNE